MTIRNQAKPVRFTSDALKLQTYKNKKSLAAQGFWALDNLERVMGIEPTLLAWKAKVLPLNYTRI